MPAFADVVRLKNGRDLSGTVSKANDGTLALAIAGGVVKLDPEDVEWTVRGTDEEIEGKRRAASQYERAELAREAGNWVVAAEAYERAAELTASADLLNNAGTAWAQAGNIDRAVPQFRRALSENPSHAAARRNLAAALRERGAASYAKGEFEAALLLWREALRLSGGGADLLNDLGSSHGMLGNRAAAERFYKKALRVAAGHGTASRNLRTLAGNA